MPYVSNKDLPTFVKKYSEKVQSQWRHVWTTVYSKTNDEGRAFAAANSILKKRFTGKEQNWNKNDNDYIIHLVDRWLGNLNG